MNEEHFRNYLEFNDQGLRKKAKEEIDNFIASFNSFEEKSVWTYKYLESESWGWKIRHELYTNIVFPVLLKGFEESDPWSFFWICRTIQNIYKNKELHAKIDNKTEGQIVRECYRLLPNEKRVRLIYVNNLAREIGYAIHEWPSGLLLQKGVTVSDLENDTLKLRQVDFEENHKELLQEVKDVISDYRARNT